MTDLPFDPGEARYVNLATFRKTGKEVRTPVWIAQDADCYYVFSEGHAGKVKRIRANGRARMAACNVRGDLRSDWLDASGRIVSEQADMDRAYAALRRKYGWQMCTLDFFSKLSGKYDKRAVIELRLADAPTGEEA